MVDPAVHHSSAGESINDFLFFEIRFFSGILRFMENTYELVVVLSPTLDDAGEKKAVDLIVSLVKQNGSVIKQTKMGKKTLAYPIKKKTEGIYWVFDIKLAPKSVKAISTKLAQDESFLRNLVVVKEAPANQKGA